MIIIIVLLFLGVRIVSIEKGVSILGVGNLIDCLTSWSNKQASGSLHMYSLFPPVL
jgi:hypothetical protein